MSDDEILQEECDMSRIFNVIYADEDEDDDNCHYGYPPEDTPLSREVDRLLDLLLDM